MGVLHRIRFKDKGTNGHALTLLKAHEDSSRALDAALQAVANAKAVFETKKAALSDVARELLAKANTGLKDGEAPWVTIVEDEQGMAALTRPLGSDGDEDYLLVDGPPGEHAVTLLREHHKAEVELERLRAEARKVEGPAIEKREALVRFSLSEAAKAGFPNSTSNKVQIRRVAKDKAILTVED